MRKFLFCFIAFVLAFAFPISVLADNETSSDTGIILTTPYGGTLSDLFNDGSGFWLNCLNNALGTNLTNSSQIIPYISASLCGTLFSIDIDNNPTLFSNISTYIGDFISNNELNIQDLITFDLSNMSFTFNPQFTVDLSNYVYNQFLSSPCSDVPSGWVQLISNPLYPHYIDTTRYYATTDSSIYYRVYTATNSGQLSAVFCTTNNNNATFNLVVMYGGTYSTNQVLDGLYHYYSLGSGLVVNGFTPSQDVVPYSTNVRDDLVREFYTFEGGSTIPNDKGYARYTDDTWSITFPDIVKNYENNTWETICNYYYKTYGDTFEITNTFIYGNNLEDVPLYLITSFNPNITNIYNQNDVYHNAIDNLYYNYNNGIGNNSVAFNTYDLPGEQNFIQSCFVSLPDTLQSLILALVGLSVLSLILGLLGRTNSSHRGD